MKYTALRESKCTRTIKASPACTYYNQTHTTGSLRCFVDREAKADYSPVPRPVLWAVEKSLVNNLLLVRKFLSKNENSPTWENLGAKSKFWALVIFSVENLQNSVGNLWYLLGKHNNLLRLLFSPTIPLPLHTHQS